MILHKGLPYRFVPEALLIQFTYSPKWILYGLSIQSILNVRHSVLFGSDRKTGHALQDESKEATPSSYIWIEKVIRRCSLKICWWINSSEYESTWLIDQHICSLYIALLDTNEMQMHTTYLQAKLSKSVQPQKTDPWIIHMTSEGRCREYNRGHYSGEKKIACW